MNFLRRAEHRSAKFSDNQGFTLVEILITLAVFGVVMSGVYGAYTSQLSHTGREYKLAAAEMEHDIVGNFLERDIDMAGYGLADDYGSTPFAPVAAAAQNGTLGPPANPNAPDTLTLMGTALGLDSRAAQAWTYVTTSSSPPVFQSWGDPRENLKIGDQAVIMDPATKTLRTEGTGKWLYKFNGVNAHPTTPPTASPGDNLTNPTVGTLVYGLQSSSGTAPTLPYYVVRYGLDKPLTNPATCAPGTQYLMRSESIDSTAPSPPLSGGDPLQACVLDFQVAFALDSDDDGAVNAPYDDGGGTAKFYDAPTLRKRLKQIVVYMLVQSGQRDRGYTYPLAKVRVGDAALGTGRDLDLTADQRKYRWKLITKRITLRNLR